MIPNVGTCTLIVQMCVKSGKEKLQFNVQATNKGEYVIRSQTLPPWPNNIASVELQRAVSKLQWLAAAQAERCVAQTS